MCHKQTTDGETYDTEYKYNLSGGLIEQNYPSGRIVKNVLDSDGMLLMIQSKKNANSGYFNYAKSFRYNATGAVESMQLGNGKWESTTFNSRLQPTQIALGTTQGGTDKLKLDYTYGTTNNNGNVQSQAITVERSNQSPLVFNQSYVYDELNRLKSAEETSNNATTWKQTYNFDRYGNRTFDTTGNNTTTLGQNFNPNIANPTADESNNRFTTSQGYVYDLNGNLIEDASGRTFIYDGENKQKEAKNSSSQSLGTYFYDGEGKRVKKVTDTETIIFVYDVGSKLVAEYSTEVSNEPKVQYLTEDNLGTPRIVTDKNSDIISRSDYMPYGEEIITYGNRTSADNYQTDDVRQGFTSYEKDDETGLDYAQARIYNNSLGRFTTTDPIIMSQERAVDPQQINFYIYVRNNPLNYIDSNGEKINEPKNLSKKDQKAYEKWRDKFKSTKEGKKTWEKYEKDKNFTLNIAVLDRGKKNKGAKVDGFEFDKDGNFVGATMTLGRNLGKGLPQNDDSYPALSSVVSSNSADIGAGKIAHEFGHLDDFQSLGKTFYKQQQVTERLNDRINTLASRGDYSQLGTDPQLVKIREEYRKSFGIAASKINRNRDRQAERNALPTYRQIFRTKFKKAQKNLDEGN